MRISIDGFAPLLQVFDMRASLAFYRDVLGFAVASSSAPRARDDFDWCLLERESVRLMLNTAYEHDARPAAPDPARVAAHRDTALFFGCPDLDGACTALRAKGVATKGPTVASYGMRQLYVQDPDGYEICLQWPATPQSQD